MKRALISILLGVLALVALVAWLNLRGEDKIHDTPPPPVPTAQRVVRGAYLARAGNCATCHTAQGAPNERALGEPAALQRHSVTPLAAGKIAA